MKFNHENEMKNIKFLENRTTLAASWSVSLDQRAYSHPCVLEERQFEKVVKNANFKNRMGRWKMAASKTVSGRVPGYSLPCVLEKRQVLLTSSKAS